MFIIEMSMYESDFVRKSTEETGALDVRTFDLDHLMSLFVYYFEDHLHLKLKRYKADETTFDDWKRLKAAGTLYPDIDLNDTLEVFLDLEDNQLHAKLPHTIFKKE